MYNTFMATSKQHTPAPATSPAPASLPINDQRQPQKSHFDPASFEENIREYWDTHKTYATRPSKDPHDKQYVLAMFPYPSGDGLHTGHVRIYTGTDVLARFYRMQGKAVFYPMGWDAFGLPAENAAIKKKTNPQSLVPQNIANFKRQYELLGMSYDWSKEINTTDPRYYAITQSLFILFFKHGLLYKKDTPVYYCPSCKTGLAQEEVSGDGTHERCGNIVERRNLPQWIFKIQEYADSLLDGLNGLDWPQGILEMQKNWIGRKEGIEITYPVVDAQGNEIGESITCFTTRPETNFGATFVVLAPEHQFVKTLVSGSPKTTELGEQNNILSDYVSRALRKTERERMTEEKTKTGVFTGYYCVNKLNGEKLPIWVSDFVLANFGTGAVVGVPGHDLRDYDFASAFSIPIKRVIQGPGDDMSEINHREQVQENTGRMINSEFLNGMDPHSATRAMMDHLEGSGMGKRVVTYHLRDWIFSRQRYWGEPIPMVFCQRCYKKDIHYWKSKSYYEDSMGLSISSSDKTFKDLINETGPKMAGWFPLDTSELPLKLPEIESYEPTESGASPLSNLPEWLTVTCPECGGEAKRETDTMPNWAGSCWYFLAYPIAENINNGTLNLKEPFTHQVHDVLPVDWYLGGAEHAVLHLLYARFWTHVLYDLAVLKVREPFSRLRNVGMVQAEDGRKMSKSLGNVVNPNDIVKDYGADALRVYEMFMAPFNQEVAWSTQTLQGAYRFIKRIWHIYSDSAKYTDSHLETDDSLASELQKVILKITGDIPDVKFNTPISSMMEFLNTWERSSKKLERGYAEAYLKLLAPFAPYVTEHIWHTVLGHEDSIHTSSWPLVDENLIRTEMVTVPIQINGKIRDSIPMSPQEDENEALEKAFASEKVKRWLPSSYKYKYVKGKILSIFSN